MIHRRISRMAPASSAHSRTRQRRPLRPLAALLAGVLVADALGLPGAVQAAGIAPIIGYNVPQAGGLYAILEVKGDPNANGLYQTNALTGWPVRAASSVWPDASINPPTFSYSQGWVVVDDGAGDGYDKIVNAYSGRCLDVNGASMQSGATIDQYPCDPNFHNQPNQLWKVVSTPGNRNLTYQIKNMGSGLYLAPTGDGGGVTQVDAQAASTWSFSTLPYPARQAPAGATTSPVPGPYEIVSAANSAVPGGPVALDVPNASTAVGTPLDTWAAHGGANQTWTLVDDGAGDGYFKVINQGNGLCLDVYGASTQGGAAIDQYACDANYHNQPNQLWKPVAASTYPAIPGAFYLQNKGSGQDLSFASFASATGLTQQSNLDGAATVQAQPPTTFGNDQWRGDATNATTVASLWYLVPQSYAVVTSKYSLYIGQVTGALTYSCGNQYWHARTEVNTGGTYYTYNDLSDTGAQAHSNLVQYGDTASLTSLATLIYPTAGTSAQYSEAVSIYYTNNGIPAGTHNGQIRFYCDPNIP